MNHTSGIMIEIEKKYGPVLLDVLEEALYQIAIRMETLKGGPMTPERKEMDQKQRLLEDLQHQVSLQVN